MRSTRYQLRAGVGRLELLLIVAVLALVFQFFPLFTQRALWVLDLRNWSREVWFIVNVMVVLALLGVRFVPSLYTEWRERSRRLAVGGAESAKRKQIEDQRETLKRIAKGRRNRIY